MQASLLALVCLCLSYLWAQAQKSPIAGVAVWGDNARMSQERFSIIYDGPALADNAMDVRDLAPALLALGSMFEEANDILNHDHARVAVQVNGSFKTGCFRIDLSVTQQLLDQLTDLFNQRSMATAKNLLEWIGLLGAGGKGLLGLLSWLKGRKPSRVELLNTGSVRVFVDGESFDTETAVLELYRHIKLRKALEDAVVKPLRKEGVETFSVMQDEQVTVTLDRAAANWLVAPEAEDEPIDDSESVISLQIVNIAFRDDNKWRFSDGAGTYYASIVDQAFLERVNKNEEAFAKGDILKVRLHRRQWLSGEDMRTEYTVLEVLEHRRATVQLPLPFS